jgi:hypothetical protein
LPESRAVRAVRGQKEPELLGWLSDRPWSLIPCATAIVERTDAPTATFATLLTFGNPVPDPANGEFDLKAAPTRLAWREGETNYAIELRRNTNEPATVNLTISGSAPA